MHARARVNDCIYATVADASEERALLMREEFL